MNVTIFEPDKPDRNGRIYTPESISMAFEDYMGKGPRYGEFGPSERMEVSLTNVSHIIEDIYSDLRTGSYCAKIKVLETPYGKALNDLLKSGASISFGIRASGEALSDGMFILNRIYTVDAIIK